MPDEAIVETPATAVASPVADSTPDLATQDGQKAHFEQSMAAAKAIAAAADTEVKIAEKAKSDALKAKDADEPAKVEKAEAETEDAPGEKGTIGKAKRLARDGDIEGAIKLTLGLDVNDLNELQLKSPHFKALVRREKAARAEVETQKAATAAEKREMSAIANQLMPLYKASEAYRQGDFDSFVKLATGDTLDVFQRKVIDKLKGDPPVRTDPALMQRLEQLEARERAVQLAEQNRKAEDAKREAADKEAKWVSEIAEELAADPKYARVSKKPAFIQKVLDLQVEHLDPHTKTTLDTLEAGELAWQELYGDVIDTPSENPGTKGKGASTGRGGTNGASGRSNATTNLKNSTATEAAASNDGPWSPERQQQLMDEWIRKAKSENLKASLG